MGIDEAVKKEPIPPAERETSIENVSFGRFNFIFLFDCPGCKKSGGEGGIGFLVHLPQNS